MKSDTICLTLRILKISTQNRSPLRIKDRIEIRYSVILRASQLCLMLEWFVWKTCINLQGILHTWKEKNDDHDNVINLKVSEQGTLISRCYNK